jgi:hypothetical protein
MVVVVYAVAGVLYFTSEQFYFLRCLVRFGLGGITYICRGAGGGIMFFNVLGVVMAVCALSFLVIGLRLLLIKDDRANKMFDGWSWMSETERAEYRAKYNMKNMTRFNGWTAIIFGVYMALLSAGNFFDFGWIGDIIPLLFIPLAIGVFVYYRKSKKLYFSQEDIIKEALSGDAQRNALSLASFFQVNDISCVRETTGYWADKIYFVCSYKGQSVCYISINESEANTWNIQGDDSGDDWFENAVLNERMKEIAWEHVSVCENETRCFDGCVRTNKVIFGKAFDSVCPITIKFENPNAAEIDCMKAIFEARKKYIQNTAA